MFVMCFKAIHVCISHHNFCNFEAWNDNILKAVCSDNMPQACHRAPSPPLKKNKTRDQTKIKMADIQARARVGHLGFRDCSFKNERLYINIMNLLSVCTPLSHNVYVSCNI